MTTPFSANWQRTLPLFDRSDAHELDDLITGLQRGLSESDREELNQLSSLVYQDRVTSVRIHLGDTLPRTLPFHTEIASDNETAPGQALDEAAMILTGDGEWGRIRDDLRSIAENLDDDSTVSVGFSWQELQSTEEETNHIRQDAYEGSLWERVQTVATGLSGTELIDGDAALAVVACDLYGFSVSEVADRIDLQESEISNARDRGRARLLDVRTVKSVVAKTRRCDSLVTSVAGWTRPDALTDPDATAFEGEGHGPENSLVGKTYKLDGDESSLTKGFDVVRAVERPDSDRIGGYVARYLGESADKGGLVLIDATEVDRLRRRGRLKEAKLVWKPDSIAQSIQLFMDDEVGEMAAPKSVQESATDLLSDATEKFSEEAMEELVWWIKRNPEIDVNVPSHLEPG